MHRVFVYGSLRGRTPKPTKAMVVGYAMYDYGPFPYVVKVDDQDSVVYGEILLVDDVGLTKLDAYENVSSGMYTREKVDVMLLHGPREATIVPAFMYVAGNIHPPLVPSGDWLEYTKETA